MVEFLTLGPFIIVVEVANYHCVICKLDNGSETIYRCANEDEKRGEERIGSRVMVLNDELKSRNSIFT